MFQSKTKTNPSLVLRCCYYIRIRPFSNNALICKMYLYILSKCAFFLNSLRHPKCVLIFQNVTVSKFHGLPKQLTIPKKYPVSLHVPTLKVLNSNSSITLAHTNASCPTQIVHADILNEIFPNTQSHVCLIWCTSKGGHTVSISA